MSYLWGGRVNRKAAKKARLIGSLRKISPLGYQMNNQNEPTTTGTPRKNEAELSQAEKKLIVLLEWAENRKLSPEEVALSLQQAREVGEL
jgi:hypothetical protein